MNQRWWLPSRNLDNLKNLSLPQGDKCKAGCQRATILSFKNAIETKWMRNLNRTELTWQWKLKSLLIKVKLIKSKRKVTKGEQSLAIMMKRAWVWPTKTKLLKVLIQIITTQLPSLFQLCTDSILLSLWHLLSSKVNHWYSDTMRVSC